jgi:alpha-D-ribose 1-methylphosphonate 5-triphosphate synthase subunit PhnH
MTMTHFVPSHAKKIGVGFTQPVFDAQRAFRAVMNALAEPGTEHFIGTNSPNCPGFSIAMTAIALTLADFETRIWIDAAAPPDAAAYLRFHTGAPIVSAHKDAAFAFITRSRDLPTLSTFAQGTLDYPDTSTTIIIDVLSIDTTRGWSMTGPGVVGVRRLAVSPLPELFASDFIANRSTFPCGVDVIFCAGTKIVALPRSTRMGAQ